ncbi:MAG: dihydroneopterin triphosphate diphosphatase [Betaproteobacteria bacterium]|nr:dihydroneopterin triphosphate diphosphatase [Betaproteobacteria bacterium]
MNYKRPVSVLVVIHSPTLECLLIERARHPGFWQSVTGSQEDDETLAETALREVFEETGIHAAPDDLLDWQMSQQFELLDLWRHRYAPGVTHNTEHVFSLCVARDTSVELSPTEHRAWRWLPLEEAVEACFSWTNRDAIRALPEKARAMRAR